MKLSDFKGLETKRRLQFVDGKAKVVEDNVLNGEVSFSSFNEEVLNRFNKQLNGKSIKDINEQEFLFKILPLISDIEVDITLADFEEMMKSPNKHFLKFIEVLMAVINDTVSTGESIMNIQNSANEINSTFGDVKVENDVEKLNRLYKEYDEISDREEKRKLMREIYSLEEKMGLNE